MRSPSRRRGVSLVEAVIGISLISFLFIGLIGAFNRFIKAYTDVNPTLKAAYLAEEGIEAVKLLRDTSWTSNITTLTASTSYYLAFSTTTSTWSATTSSAYAYSGNLLRSFALYNVSRDATTHDIVTSGGTNDANTKRLTVSVSWRTDPSTTTKSITTYITNLFGN